MFGVEGCLIQVFFGLMGNVEVTTFFPSEDLTYEFFEVQEMPVPTEMPSPTSPGGDDDEAWAPSVCIAACQEGTKSE